MTILVFMLMGLRYSRVINGLAFDGVGAASGNAWLLWTDCMKDGMGCVTLF